jgi:hypothetical protein
MHVPLQPLHQELLGTCACTCVYVAMSPLYLPLCVQLCLPWHRQLAFCHVGGHPRHFWNPVKRQGDDQICAVASSCCLSCAHQKPQTMITSV